MSNFRDAAMIYMEEALRNAAVEKLKEAQTDQDKVKKENTRLW